MTSAFEPPPVLDLRQDGLSPASTIVTVHADYRGHAWIHAGEVELTERAWSQGNRGCWTLEVRRRGATDFEHDTAVALRMGLAGVAFRMASGGRLWLDAVIAGDDPSLFRVPEPEWDQLKGAIKCLHANCRTKDARHLVVEEGRYIPPHNEALFERLRGLRVEIVTGVSR
jgi:hypothetical protein